MVTEEPDCLGETSPSAQPHPWLSGYVCERKNLLANGCCDVKVPSTKQYCCEGCLVSGCCEVYEYCVSCCLQPSKVGTPTSRRFVFRASSGVLKRSFIGTLASPESELVPGLWFLCREDHAIANQGSGE